MLLRDTHDPQRMLVRACAASPQIETGMMPVLSLTLNFSKLFCVPVDLIVTVDSGEICKIESE